MGQWIKQKDRQCYYHRVKNNFWQRYNLDNSQLPVEGSERNNDYILDLFLNTNSWEVCEAPQLIEYPFVVECDDYIWVAYNNSKVIAFLKGDKRWRESTVSVPILLNDLNNNKEYKQINGVERETILKLAPKSV